jgi:hypothetical protein
VLGTIASGNVGGVRGLVRLAALVALVVGATAAFTMLANGCFEVVSIHLDVEL